MGRHTKLKPPSKTTKPPEHALPTARDEDDLRLSRCAAQIERLMDVVDRAIDSGDCNPALLREATSLSRAVASLSAERRARAKQAIQIAGKVSPELVMAHLRQLEPERRSHVIRELQALDSGEGSILA